jgi:hypothetical protein
MSTSAHRPLSGRFHRARTVVCEDAQQALSARFDDEPLPLPGAVLDTHLVTCQACQDFQTNIVTLGRLAPLRAPRRVPEDLLATLAPLLGPASGPESLGHTQLRRGPRFGSLLNFGWAAPTVPATLALVAISLGVGTHPHMVPTRPPSPCTVGLIERHLQRGG